MSIADKLNTIYNNLDNSLEEINAALIKKSGSSSATINGIADSITQLPVDTSISDSIIDNTITRIDSDVESVADYKFYECETLLSVNMPHVKTVGEMAFSGCSSMADVYMPEAEHFKGNSFDGCGIVHADFPALSELNSAAFFGCAYLSDVDMPSVITTELASFGNCVSLRFADFTNIRIINARTFEYCTSLEALILRNNAVVSLRDINALKRTLIDTGSGHIYVPMALLAAYKNATNWTVFSSRFRAIEAYPEITGETV